MVIDVQIFEPVFRYGLRCGLSRFRSISRKMPGFTPASAFLAYFHSQIYLIIAEWRIAAATIIVVRDRDIYITA